MSSYELPKRRRIFLMRHGDVTYFDDSGHSINPENVPLNERGREEASAAGREFAAQAVRRRKTDPGRNNRFVHPGVTCGEWNLGRP